MNLDEILAKAKVTSDDYQNALSVSNNGGVVVLKRKPKECNINNYNVPVLLAWQANMDLQYVLNAYACVMYVASYIMKTDRAMGELLKRVASETRTEELKVQMKKVGSAFLTHREVSAQEAVSRLLSLPMKQLSRSVVFIDTNPKNERISVLKDNIKDLDDNDPNVFLKNLLDRYQHRPQEVQAMCLGQFIDQYITCSIPEVEGKLKELVLQLQNHRHSSYCKRNNSCRFGFPHPPSDNTLIAEPCEPCEHSTDPIETLKKSVRFLQVVVVMI